MTIDESCRFCAIGGGHYKYSEIDQPIMTTSAYMAVASIGALVEGWTLIIPKAHDFSLRSTYEEADFIEFTAKFTNLLRIHYGPVIAFEHGANRAGSLTACGTDHAHLHLVPFGSTLVPELQQSNLEWIACRPAGIRELVGDNEYLFYTDLANNSRWGEQFGYLHIIGQPISQFFRNLIARRLRCEREANYRDFPHLETSIRTSQRLAKLHRHCHESEALA